MRIAAVVSSFFIAGLIIGCSDVGFKTEPSSTCVNFNQSEDQECVWTPDGNIYSVKFHSGLIDILFVNDNSGSMSREQEKMANAFSGFLNSISQFDYQIAMVTTDIEKDGGRLLTFVDENGNTDGEKVLKKGTSNIVSKFKGTIQRQETLTCDMNGYNHPDCPSNDERGIYAANTAIVSNEAGWLRDGAHTVIIPITDESQRSKTEWDATVNDWVGGIAGKPLEANDYPETLVTNFTSRYASKSLAVHPIIVKPGDSTCLANQKTYKDLSGNTLTYPLLGFYGYLWNELARATANDLDIDANGNPRNIVNGTVGNICSSTYYSQLNLIGSYSASNANRNEVQMQCLPAMEDINVESSQPVNYYVDEENKRVVFEGLPIGVEIQVSWVCDNTI
jgi:hypothetical protein